MLSADLACRTQRDAESKASVRRSLLFKDLWTSDGKAHSYVRRTQTRQPANSHCGLGRATIEPLT